VENVDKSKKRLLIYFEQAFFSLSDVEKLLVGVLVIDVFSTNYFIPHIFNKVFNMVANIFFNFAPPDGND